MRKNLIVAAHSDDAALSLGGIMLKERGKFTVLNVFSTCARTILNSTDPAAITRINNQEEKEVMELLDAELIMLNVDEVLLRGYTTWQGPVDYEQDAVTIDRITRIVFDTVKAYETVYIPLAIGDHIDHAILYRTGITLYTKKVHTNVVFYEDLPYAYYAPVDWSKKREKNIHLKSEFIDITDCIDQKITILTTYASQYTLSDLQVVKEYASSLKKDGRFYERIWKVS